MNNTQETILREQLAELLAEAGIRSVSYEEAGVMTRNEGLVLDCELGRFQLTIVPA